jgi:proline iminopeptidase
LAAGYDARVNDVRFEVTVPGGILAGVRGGRGDPLLVLHGGPGLSDYSGMLADELTGWDALRYTQRGVDPSTTSGPFTVGQHVSDAVAVLDQHGIGAAVVLGHSWGGYLAMQLAAAAAERVRALVLVDSLGAVGDGGFAAFAEELTARTSSQTLARLAELGDLASASADTAALESLRLSWPSYFADQSVAPAPPDGLRMSRACYTSTFESISAAQADGLLPALLAQFSGPVEIVAGGASPFPHDVATSTGALFRNAQVTMIDGAGHFPWVERPGCVAAALWRIAARLAATDRGS